MTGDFYRVLFAAAFVLNTLWEYAQTFAFKTDDLTWGAMLLFWTLATIVDAFVTIGICRLVSRFVARFNTVFYLLTAILSALCAIGFEAFAFATGLWSYNEGMPALPVLETGLLPFLQLTILVPLAIWLAARWTNTGGAGNSISKSA